jgi:ATP-dependent Zn protease
MNRSMHSKLSENSKERIDKEIQFMISSSLKTILKIVEKNMDQLNIVAGLLLDFKTINGEKLKERIKINMEINMGLS